MIIMMGDNALMMTDKLKLLVNCLISPKGLIGSNTVFDIICVFPLILPSKSKLKLY